MRLNDAIYYSSNIIKKSKFKISISIITIFLLIVSSVVLISSSLNVKNNIKKNLIEAYELNGASVVIHKTSGIYNAEYNNL